MTNMDFLIQQHKDSYAGEGEFEGAMYGFLEDLQEEIEKLKCCGNCEYFRDGACTKTAIKREHIYKHWNCSWELNHEIS